MGQKRRNKSNTKLRQKVADSLLPLDDEYLISTQDDQCVEERRFLWKIDDRTQGPGKLGTEYSGDAFMSMPGKGVGKHQVNYSATKYIKP